MDKSNVDTGCVSGQIKAIISVYRELKQDMPIWAALLIAFLIVTLLSVTNTLLDFIFLT
ncbi:hypothetical protein [uncultured Endozoicomonas sp.]|uniref:hypothetical protein n=1 Tax=uncultured Endozoicomonas sp. TaxID=432652 RepID=UPI00261DE5D8|nr:hypothetical protein [uncultured Endozoicomonas sp.]